MAPQSQSMALDVKSGKRSAYFSSLLTFVTTVLVIVMATRMIKIHDDASCEYKDIMALNLRCLREFWKASDSLQSLTFSFEIVGGIAAFLLVPPFLVLNEIYRRNGRPSQVMVPAIAAACGVRILEFTFNAGVRMHSNWMVKKWTLTDQDLKAVTISFFTVQSQGTWLFAMDYLFLAFGQISAALLTYKCQNTMPRWWGHLGMVAGVIGLLNFLVELGRLGSWLRMSEIGFLLQAVDGFILMPIWTLALGCKLYSASATSARQLMDDDQRGGLATRDGAGDGAGNAQSIELPNQA